MIKRSRKKKGKSADPMALKIFSVEFNFFL